MVLVNSVLHKFKSRKDNVSVMSGFLIVIKFSLMFLKKILHNSKVFS